jgi:hypothetical protein
MRAENLAATLRGSAAYTAVKGWRHPLDQQAEHQADTAFRPDRALPTLK